MDILEQANEWLNQQRLNFMSQYALYIRGTEQFMVNATIGKTDYEVEDDYGIRIKASAVDFLIASDELLFTDGFDTPKPGDKIRISKSDAVITYEVMDLSGQGCWQYSDPYNKLSAYIPAGLV